MERSIVVLWGLVGLWIILIIGLFYALASHNDGLFQLMGVIALVLTLPPLTLRSRLKLRRDVR